MNKTYEKSRIEYVRPELINERIAELDGIGESTVQIEPVTGGFLIEHVETKAFAAQSTLSGKLKKANAEIRSLKKQLDDMERKNEGLREKLKRKDAER